MTATSPATLPLWAEMTDTDRGAALVHLWKRLYEGHHQAVELYPCQYIDHPALAALDPAAACRHATDVAVSYDHALHRLGTVEVDRLYRLAAHPSPLTLAGALRLDAVTSDLPFVSVQDMEAMTPNERLEAVAARTVTNPEDVPEDVRERARAGAPPARDTVRK